MMCDKKKNMIRSYYADGAVHTDDAQESFNDQVLSHLVAAKRHLDKKPLSFSLLCICCSVPANRSCSHRDSRVA